MAPADPDGPDGPDGRAFLIAGILALVVVIATIAWTARPDDGLAEVERNEERFPAPTTLPPPTTQPTVPVVDAGDRGPDADTPADAYAAVHDR